MPVLLWSGAGAVGIAILAAIGQHRRTVRADLDRIGFVDWRGVQLGALMVAAILISIGLNAR